MKIEASTNATTIEGVSSETWTRLLNKQSAMVALRTRPDAPSTGDRITLVKTGGMLVMSVTVIESIRLTMDREATMLIVRA